MSSLDDFVGANRRTTGGPGWSGPSASRRAKQVLTPAAAWSLSVAMGALSFGQPVELLTEPRSLGVLVARIDAPPDANTDWDLSIEFTKVGATEPAVSLRVGTTAQADLRLALWRKAAPKLQVVVPITFRRHAGQVTHLFSEAGRYRLHIEPGAPKQVFPDREVAVAAPSAADLQYFARTRDEEIWKMWGVDRAEAQRRELGQPEVFGLTLFASVVDQTLSDIPTRGRPDWGEALLRIALSVPDSAYAPYVSYYAACSFLEGNRGPSTRTKYGIDVPDARIRNLEFYQKARQAARFAAERGDPYIAPFAVVVLAGLEAMGGAYDDARRLLDEIGHRDCLPPGIESIIAEVETFIAKHATQPGQ